MYSKMSQRMFIKTLTVVISRKQNFSSFILSSSCVCITKKFTINNVLFINQLQRYLQFFLKKEFKFFLKDKLLFSSNMIMSVCLYIHLHFKTTWN